MSVKILLTCEHGGAEIPAAYQKLFKNQKAVLKTHRALDIGALKIAQDLKPLLKSALHYSIVSRLVVDLNRHLQSKTLFSEFTEPLSEQEKQKILKRYYSPYWDDFKNSVKSIHGKKLKVVHVSVHSMTDFLYNKRREMQIALLYDTQKALERKFAQIWYEELKLAFPDYKIARNNPYKVYHQKLPCAVKEACDLGSYTHIELEMNQQLLKSFKTSAERKAFSKKLGHSLSRARERFIKIKSPTRRSTSPEISGP